MKYNFINELDLSNPITLILCLLAIIAFFLVGHKVIIPIYKKYLKKHVQGKPKKK